ncbi:hypothetical protein QJQ45_018304 [Haematococcus lacustris]|nr:hypothetical protein QJQ45_018304 [Haematococcus lacustris]
MPPQHKVSRGRGGGWGGGGGAGGPHDFLLQPVSGVLRYTRRSAALRRQVQEGAGGRSAGGPEAAGLSLKEAGGQAPGQDWVLGLEQVVLCLSSGQYAGGQALAQSLDCLAQASPHRHLRPRCRPHAGDSGLAARLWWRYAYRALAKRLARQRGGMSWSRLQRTAGLRKLYVPAYLQALQQVEQAGQAGGAASGKVKAVGLVGLSEGEGGAQLQAMEAQLEEGSILLFRRMAHAKLQSLHTSTGPRSASSPAKPSPPGAAAAAAAAAGGGTTRTWAGWLGLGPRLPPAAAPASADSGRGSEGGVVQGPGPGVGVERESLTVEEWGRLHELLAAQDQAAQDEAGAADKDTPFTLRARVHISVICLALALVQSPVATSSLSAAAVATARGLVDGGDRLRTQPPASYTATPGKKSVCSASTGPMLGLLQPALLVAHASSERLTVQLLSFPTTMAGSLQVGAAGITTQYGQLFSTGALAQELVTAEGPAAPASPPVTPFSDVPGVFGDSAASRMQLAQNAMALEVVRAPQDNSSDVTASLLIAPSFITYVPEAVAAVTRFFTLHRDLDLVALQAQATSRAEALRRAAAQQLSALSLLDSRPRLRLTLCAHAPKVALPAPSGQALLLLDLGRFSLHSNSDLAASLPPEEAALFDCFSARIDSLAAHLALSPTPRRFTWPTPPSAPSAAAPHPSSSRHSGHGPDSSSSSRGGEGGGERGSGSGRNWVGGSDWDLVALFDAQGEGGGEMEMEGERGGAPPAASLAVGGASAAVLRGVGGQGQAQVAVGQGASRPGGWRLQPLLERFALSAEVQLAQAVHPRWGGGAGGRGG